MNNPLFNHCVHGISLNISCNKCLEQTKTVEITPRNQCNGHRKVVCRCGNIVSQCRCIDMNKAVSRLSSCEKCSPKTITLETPQQQRERIQVDLSNDIVIVGNQNNNDHQMVGLQVYRWLVDARIKIEELQRELKELKIRDMPFQRPT